LLPGLVGPGRAAEHLLTGDSIAARQALEWGLVNRVAPLDHLEGVTLELLGRILECSPAAVRLQKELIINWRNLDQRSAIEQGIDAFARAYATREPHEAMDAFLEKRKPKFVMDDRRWTTDGFDCHPDCLTEHLAASFGNSAPSPAVTSSPRRFAVNAEPPQPRGATV
jgi:hypothetical protein